MCLYVVVISTTQMRDTTLGQSENRLPVFNGFQYFIFRSVTKYVGYLPNLEI